MFTTHFTNVICSSEGREFATLNAAIADGKASGFEFTVRRAGKRVASWSIFGGLRYAAELHIEDATAESAHWPSDL